MPSPTSAPQSLNPPQNPTTSPTSNSNHTPSPTHTIYPTPSKSIPTISTGPTLPVELNHSIVYILLAIGIAMVAAALVSVVYFRRRKEKS
jgi:hypothetical protein